MDIYDEVESTFVRKSFYVKPPDTNASKEDWHTWLKEDSKKAAVEKRRHTLLQEATEIPESFQETATRKINGVYRQVPSVGLVGNTEEGCRAEPAEEAQQSKVIIMADWKPNLRGSKSGGRNSRRIAARKAKAIALEKDKYSL